MKETGFHAKQEAPMSLTLIIMAAGMGSRYGSLKQMDPLGPGGEIMLEYSVHDALKAGFNRVVFVIRRSFQKEFETLIAERIRPCAETVCVCQELDILPRGFSVPEGREKPWGTGHAVLVCREAVDGPFAVINADDYYGPASFQIAADFLLGRSGGDRDDYALVAYPLERTLSEHGHVSRAVCLLDETFHLARVVEHKKIGRDGMGVIRSGEEDAAFNGDELVSMNFWAFQPSFFSALERAFPVFLMEKGGDPRSEFLIPEIVDGLIRREGKRVRVLPTPDTWFGVTYREDRESAINKIRSLVKEGVYPETLFRA